MSETNQSNTTNLEPQDLEQGDIYFFYRPKKDAQEGKSIEHVRRFCMVTAREAEKEASYVISVINPRKPAASSVAEGGKYPSTEEIPAYPEEVLREFGDSDIFVSLSKDTKLIDYQNAQIILIGAREGRDVIKQEIGIEIEEEGQQEES